jgi:hypothetical protein
MPLAVYMDVHVPAAVTEGLRRKSLDVRTAQADAAGLLETSFDAVSFTSRCGSRWMPALRQGVRRCGLESWLRHPVHGLQEDFCDDHVHQLDLTPVPRQTFAAETAELICRRSTGP